MAIVIFFIGLCYREENEVTCMVRERVENIQSELTFIYSLFVFYFLFPWAPGGFSVNFRRYARLGNKFVTLCTDIFAWKMYPLYWNVQKILPQNAPIFMKCTENLAPNSTHLQAICGTNFIQRYTSFLTMITMIKCTRNRTVKLYSFL